MVELLSIQIFKFFNTGNKNNLKISCIIRKLHTKPWTSSNKIYLTV